MRNDSNKYDKCGSGDDGAVDVWKDVNLLMRTTELKAQ
jgi:hypothetical protein